MDDHDALALLLAYNKQAIRNSAKRAPRDLPSIFFLVQH